MERVHIRLDPGADLDGFRAAVRRLIAAEVAPEQVIWSANEEDLFGVPAEASVAPSVALPRAIAELIRLVVCHNDPERYALLYQLIWRVLHGERALPEIASEPLVHRLSLMAKTIRRDIHKMHAFLRFREVEDPNGGERYVAWFEPEHFILEAAAPFFVTRFRNLAWSILTPLGSLHWNGEMLTAGPAARRADAPGNDPLEATWRSYYESIFNPARVNPKAMLGHMPKKYWRNLPETQAVSSLVHEAPQRMRAMIEKEAAMPTKRDPEKAVAAMGDQDPKTLKALNKLIAAAEPLVPGADHAVLGEGPEGAPIAFVGEQPGDQEDLAGRPFVGPAGKLLDQALEEAGLDRKSVYVTNAVKHFKFEQRGKRRIHQKPTMGEVKRYRWWLMKELDLVHPKLVVALGGTAAAALTGKAVSVTKARGKASFENRPGYITVHPSYLLRIPDADAKDEAYKEFVADLRKVRALAA
jgi:probable DNA metabolism protein